MINLYRSMCREEFDRTIKSNTFDFTKKRFKWFTPNMDYQSRVRDGKFNNSKFTDGRYDCLVKFKVDDSSKNHFSKLNNREVMIDRRKAHQIKITKIEVLTQ